jgi:hypothetical protein
LKERKNRKAGTLSGGGQQMLAIISFPHSLSQDLQNGVILTECDERSTISYVARLFNIRGGFTDEDDRLPKAGFEAAGININPVFEGVRT